MTELGLSRISRLVNAKQLPWRAIHVAGTNGKGSICAYTSSMLKKTGVRCGRFTSPHLIDRWDCITIDEKTVAQALFQTVEAEILEKNHQQNIKASSFELLTATAFELFSKEKVQVGVVEVGLGGRLDATNILTAPHVTIISKIGLDHQNLLGDTITQIAGEKAGIMKPGVPCIIDGTNSPAVLDVLKCHASDIKAGQLTIVSREEAEHSMQAAGDMPLHQKINFSCAIKGVEILLSDLEVSADTLDSARSKTNLIWPARLQEISIAAITGRTQPVLLDGAHNSQSAEVLGSYVDERLRTQGKPVTWILAMTSGKDIKSIVSSMVRPGDAIIPVQFGPVDGMPWIEPATIEEILSSSNGYNLRPIRENGVICNLVDTIHCASQESNGGPLVIAGSLYLAGDVLRLLRNASAKGPQ